MFVLAAFFVDVRWIVTSATPVSWAFHGFRLEPAVSGSTFLIR